MKPARSLRLIAALLAVCFAFACSGSNPSMSATSTPLLNALANTPAPIVIPTATPGATTSAPSAPAAPVATIAPSTPTAASSPVATAPSATSRTLTITRDDNGKQLQATKGDRVVVSLGQDLDWTVKTSDPSVVLTPAPGSPPADAQAVYIASASGTTTISGSGAPHCAPGAICPLFRVAFQVDVTVR